MTARLGRKILAVTLGSILALLAAVLFALCAGTTRVAPHQALAAIFDAPNQDIVQTIVMGIRLPRAILAAVAGASLSLGGMVFQAILRNPLAEPYILGISGGAAIGAVSIVVLGMTSFWAMACGSFAGSFMASALVMSLAWKNMGAKSGNLLLSGVMINAFCSAIILFLITMTKMNSLHYVLFWLMGNLSSPPLMDLGYFLFIAIPCFLFIFIMSQPMNLMLLGESQAHSLGVNVEAACAALVGVVSLMIAATVSFCGLLGFVGLVVPHAFRLVLGPDHRVLCPACLFGGAAYLVVCDTLARSLPQGGELPTGVVTAVIGAPVFIWLLRRNTRGSAS